MVSIYRLFTWNLDWVKRRQKRNHRVQPLLQIGSITDDENSAIHKQTYEILHSLRKDPHFPANLLAVLHQIRVLQSFDPIASDPRTSIWLSRPFLPKRDTSFAKI